MSNQTLQRLHANLKAQAGISPSDQWLRQCLHHLDTNHGGGGAATEENIWQQILHCDLRDVVRSSSNDGSSSNNGSDDNSDNGSGDLCGEEAARILREAIETSKRSNGNGNSNSTAGGYRSIHKATLPANFKLLVQMEEAVDGTMNSEQSLGGSATSNNSNIGGNGGFNGGGTRNPKYRSLKIAFSDGYCANGTSSNHNEACSTMQAMETHPLSTLSPHSPPGTKLLLHGPITVRFGILQLNDANAIVLGGSVAEWTNVAEKVKERVRRERGVGVDPTLRALIWNPLMGDEEGECYYIWFCVDWDTGIVIDFILPTMHTLFT